MTSASTVVAPATGTAPVAQHTRGNRETWVALGFIVPTVFGFVVFYLWPSLRGLGLSLTDYKFFAGTSFVGLANYQRILTDETFWNAMAVTVWYVVLNIGFQTVLIALIGGASTLWGPLIAAVVFSLLAETLRLQLPQLYMMSLGVLLIVCVLYLPGGLASLRWPGRAAP